MAYYEAVIAAMHRLFADPLLARKNGDGRFWANNQLDSTALLDASGTWSSGERVLATLARELSGHPIGEGDARFSVVDACATLNSTHLWTMLEVLAMYAGALPPGARLEDMKRNNTTLPAALEARVRLAVRKYQARETAELYDGGDGPEAP